MRAERVVLFLVIVVGGIVVIGAIVAFGLGVLLLAEAVAVIVAVALVIGGVGAVIRDLLVPAPAACGLVRRWALRDTCEGACGPDMLCTVTGTRNYVFGLLTDQAETCACAPSDD